MDYGKELLRVLKSQRICFVRTVDFSEPNGRKIITNPLLYNQCENEIFRLSQLISKENKKLLPKNIKKECIYV